MNEKQLASGDRTNLEGKILLSSGLNKGLVEFEIDEFVKQGSSVKCYKAHNKSGRGILKEFYPKKAFSPNRNSEGQLVDEGSYQQAHAMFERRKRRYINSHERMLEEKKTNEILSSFIPYYEIYYGCDRDGNRIGTVYIWIPESNVEPFEDFCNEIHEHPDEQPEYKLFSVLTGIRSLTWCVNELHRIGWVHGDLKPSNFGYQKSGKEKITQAITIFDFDSMSSLYDYDDVSEVFASEGYVEPEGLGNPPDAPNEQTDVYSIGAILFHSIVVNNTTAKNDDLFRKEIYDSLDELVDTSELIRASESCSIPRLRHILKQILRKCLCKRKNRYKGCEELLKDLDEALFYVTPAALARKEERGVKWILTDAKKLLDVGILRNSSEMIGLHLFETPLYEKETENEKALNILLLGLGIYGTRFLDCCLQVGQMLEKKLNIYVVSDNEKDLQEYLKERPALKEFFTITGEKTDDKEKYGEIRFLKSHLDNSDPEHLRESLKNIKDRTAGGYHVHYVFVALGDDKLSHSAAHICNRILNEKADNTSIQYVREGRQIADTENVRAVYVRKDVKTMPGYADMERMAFNMFSVYSPNTELAVLKKKFQDPFDHKSNVESVISLKYKLHSIGIDLDPERPDLAAKEVHKRFSGNAKNREQLVDDLIWMEHRRWLVQRICEGWTRLEDLSFCLSGNERDRKGKRNLCIVRSKRKHRLDKTFTINGNTDKWDAATKKELDELDDLDRLSVELHRFYAREASKRSSLVDEETLKRIRHDVSDDRIVREAYMEWDACIHDIKNKEKDRVRQYDRLKKNLIDTLERLPEEKRQRTANDIKIVDDKFYVLKRSMEYKDWKKIDEKLIEQIPFILTHRETSCIAVPFMTGDNDKLFANAAAAVMLDPAKVLYLCYLETEEDAEKVKAALKPVIRFLDRKHIRSKISLLLLYTPEVSDIIAGDYAKDLRKEPRIGSVQQKEVSEIPEAVSMIESYLKKQSKDQDRFLLERIDKRVSGLSDALSDSMATKGLYKTYPCYSLDVRNRSFKPILGCEELFYLPKTAFMTVNDVTAFNMSSSNSGKHPEFYKDFEILWKKYREDIALWKELTTKLIEHTRKYDNLASFTNLEEKYKLQTEELSYILPVSCRRSVEKILDSLKSTGIIEEDSHVSEYSSDACEAVIFDRCNNAESFDKLFSQIYLLIDSDSIKLRPVNDNKYNVTVDQLTVRNLSIGGENRDKLYELLSWFSKDRKYLINLRSRKETPNDPHTSLNVAFTFASHQVKELLTVAGKMLEVFIYHKVRESGRFDDVTSSYELYWGGSDVSNEFDCVITSGFRTVFIECKARKNLNQDNYFKIKELKDQFGINAQAVLIADTEDQGGDSVSGPNKQEFKRGKMLDVVTVHRLEDIENIGETLQKIIDGTYTA